MADKSTGFIPLWRSIVDWDWYGAPMTKVVFLHCLLMANYTEKSWQGIQIEPGSFVSSIRQIAAANNISEKAVRLAITNLKKTGELSTQRIGNGRNAGTLFMLKNWQSFNVIETDETQQGHNEDPTKTQQGTPTNKGKKKKGNNLPPKSPMGDTEKEVRTYGDDIDTRDPMEILG